MTQSLIFGTSYSPTTLGTEYALINGKELNARSGRQLDLADSAATNKQNFSVVNNEIKIVNTHKVLGVHIDSNLRWDNNIQYLTITLIFAF